MCGWVAGGAPRIAWAAMSWSAPAPAASREPCSAAVAVAACSSRSAPQAASPTALPPSSSSPSSASQTFREFGSLGRVNIAARANPGCSYNTSVYETSTATRRSRHVAPCARMFTVPRS